MYKTSLITLTAAIALTNAATAEFSHFDGIVSEYDDGTTVWQVINMYAVFDTNGTEAVLNVFNADITTRDELGFHHNDLADGSGGSWKPSFSFDIPGVYDPMRDSYVDLGYGVGALAALNQTTPDPNFGTALGGHIPFGAGWFNLTPDNPRWAEGGILHIGQFVWDSVRSENNPWEFFSFEADIGFNEGPGTTVSFGHGSYSWFIPSPGALAFLGLNSLITRRRRR